jgi:hypothetical protein
MKNLPGLQNSLKFWTSNVPVPLENNVKKQIQLIYRSSGDSMKKTDNDRRDGPDINNDFTDAGSWGE